jgi:hypothetical protein
MVEHIEPIPDGILATPERRASRARVLFESHLSWVLNEALLFPVVALYLITLAGALPRELLSDSWFVILGGREVAHHGLPTHDALTVWAHGRAWVDQQWLGQLIFYGLYALGGIKLVLFTHFAAVGSAFVLAIAIARWRGASTRSVCWVSVPAFFLLVWGSWNARAQSFAFLLFVALVWLLVSDARSPSRKVFFFVPLLVLWANIHGTAATGALFVALAGLCYAYERRRRPLRTWAPRAAAMVTLPFVCLFASPYATSLPGYYDRMLLSSPLRSYIIEWKATTLSFQTAPFYFLALLAVWLAGRRGDRLFPIEKVLLAVTAVMGFQTFRSVVWFAVLGLMLLPVALDAVLKPQSSAAQFSLLNRAFVVASTVGVVLTVGAVASKPSSWFEGNYPKAALAAVDRVEQRDPNVRVFANEQYSDWLLLRRPELGSRLAYDVRFELLSRRQLKRLIDARRLVAGWQKTVAPYGLFVLKTDVERGLGKALRKQRGARVLYRGHDLLVIYRPVSRGAK